jgi:predicted helicase
MSIAIESIRAKLPRILKDGTERTLYPELCPFIAAVANEEPVNKKGVEASAEESSTQHESGVGFPDITVRYGKEITGWIEVKLPGKTLDHQTYVQQFLKYKSSLENVIFTNLQEWELWQWDRTDKEKPKRIKRVNFDLRKNDSEENQKDFLEMLVHFFEYQPTLAKTPKQLALALARKTRLLSQQVEEAVKTAEKENEKENELLKLKDLFEKTLIQDLNIHQFANMVAETVSYSLFLSRLEHEERSNKDDFTLTTANDYIPESVPILSDLYQLISKVSKEFPAIHSAALALLEQLNRADITKIRIKLTEHKIGEDPVIQFYEPFLVEFDPVERKRRGVYYTPKPVVDFIVRSVDFLLKDRFGKNDGLADETVKILDPATGTGTFLLSAIQQVHATVQKRNEGLGKDIVKKVFRCVITNHVLKHFYGFELLAAPYAIAHLKLTLETQRLGFEFNSTKNDKDKENDRFKVYLANTLDDPNQPPKLDLPGYHLAEESNRANQVKKDTPIIAVIGNPPYSKITTNLSDYMKSLTTRYKFIDGIKIKEKGALQLEINLNDDYVKFIGFAQKLIERQAEGLIGFITNHNYLDNPTMRAMRHDLMSNFSEIYILNLHGNSKKKNFAKEQNDMNVFSIEQGVCISFFIKKDNKKEKAKIFYSEIIGPQSQKFEALSSWDFENIKWNQLYPKDPQFFFIPKDDSLESEFNTYTSITEIFPINSAGIITARDALAIAFDSKSLEAKIENYRSSNHSNENLATELGMRVKKGWNMTMSRKSLVKEENLKAYIGEIYYRPFDYRYIFYHRDIVWSMSQPVMRQLWNQQNLALLFTRQVTSLTWNHVHISNSCVEIKACSHDRSTQIAPLYSFEASDDWTNLESRIPNIDSKFAQVFCHKLGMTFSRGGLGDLKNQIGPEAIMYFTFAILHSPEYRKRYASELKSAFPKIPFTANKKLFLYLVEAGKNLVDLNLLGNNPFGSSKSIFDETKKWKIRASGKCPLGLDDWKIEEVHFSPTEQRVYVNQGQYFEGVEPEVWAFHIGGYPVLEKWLKDRKKDERSLSVEELKYYMKIVVSLRETIRVMKKIDEAIDIHGGWPIK